jgi:DNA-directed RNA polymerase subunit E'/Rpb7
MATARMTLFKPIFIDQRIALTPSEFSEAASDIDAYLVAKIRKDLEGQCCTHGYVRPGSTQILARSMGQGEHGRFTGDFLYTCKVKIMCLLPVADQIIEARVLKMNKLGAYALIVDEGRLREAMRILLPRDLHLGNTTFDSLTEGKGVRIRLMKSRFQAKDAFISSIGIFEDLAPGADVDAVAESEVVTLQPAVPDTEPVAKRKKKVAETQAAQNITLTAAYDAPPITTKSKVVQETPLKLQADQNITLPAAYEAPPITTKSKAVRNIAAAAAAPAPALAEEAATAEESGSEEAAIDAGGEKAAIDAGGEAAAAEESGGEAAAAEESGGEEEAPAPAPAAAAAAPSLLESVSNAFSSFQKSAEELGLAPPQEPAQATPKKAT